MKRHLFAFFVVLFASLPMLFAVSDAVGHKQETISEYESDSIPADSAETPVLHMNNDGTEGNIRPETRIWPEAPRAWQFRQVTMPVPALVTGAATFDVPLYEIELDGFKLPLSLKYHSNGIRWLAAEASGSFWQV